MLAYSGSLATKKKPTQSSLDKRGGCGGAGVRGGREEFVAYLPDATSLFLCPKVAHFHE